VVGRGRLRRLAGAAGPAREDPRAIERAGRGPGAVAYLMPTGHNPAGTVMPLQRRQALAAACADGRHRHFARLSFAEQPGTLELAAERLAAAWELHAENLAASPAAGLSYPERARASAPTRP
jgi:hypothetical protein